MHNIGRAGDRVHARCFHGGHIGGKGRGTEKISENSEEGSTSDSYDGRRGVRVREGVVGWSVHCPPNLNVGDVLAPIVPQNMTAFGSRVVASVIS